MGSLAVKNGLAIVTFSSLDMDLCNSWAKIRSFSALRSFLDNFGGLSGSLLGWTGGAGASISSANS